MSPPTAVRAYWEAMQDRRWDDARSTLADDVAVDRPDTGESWVGGDAVIAMQRSFPDTWAVEVLRVVGGGPVLAAEVEVREPDEVFRCASFSEVEDGRIVRSTEYWVTVGGEEVPGWRR